MHTRFLSISGSPRDNGNTDYFLERAVDIASSLGLISEKIKLSKLNINPCNGCGACLRSGVCVIKDDIRNVFQALDESDVIIIGAPLYFCNISAQTKIMVDRAQERWARLNLLKKRFKTGVKAGIFVLSGHMDNEKYFVCSRSVISSFYNMFNIKLRASFYMKNLEHKHDAQKNNKAYALFDTGVEKVIKGE